MLVLVAIGCAPFGMAATLDYVAAVPLFVTWLATFITNALMLFYMALYTRGVVIAVFTGILWQPVPWYLQPKLLMGVIVMLVLPIVVLTSLAFLLAPYLVSFVYFFQAAAGVFFFSVSVTSFSVLWQKVKITSIATASHKKSHPMRKGLRKNLAIFGISKCLLDYSILSLQKD